MSRPTSGVADDARIAERSVADAPPSRLHAIAARLQIACRPLQFTTEWWRSFCDDDDGHVVPLQVTKNGDVHFATTHDEPFSSLHLPPSLPHRPRHARPAPTMSTRPSRR